MSSAVTRSAEAQAAPATTVDPGDFANLLQREFRTRSDQAQEAVETAVRTLAEQALRDTSVISDDVVDTIQSIIASIDEKLSAQINEMLHHRGVPAAGIGLARPASPGLQHRDRRDAEDPRLPDLEEGAVPQPAQVQGHRLGPEPAVQEDL